jgi:magnesium-transporting ATPase (P-type)
VTKAVANFGTPLRAVQLLWINMIMDSMAALALGTEKPTRQLLRNKPEGRETNLITRIMIRNMASYAVIELALLIGFLFFAPQFLDITPGKDIQGPSIHYTMLFNTFVFCQIFNEINCRKVGNGRCNALEYSNDLITVVSEINVFSGFFTNWIFVSIIIFTIGVQFVLVQFAGEFFYTVPLGLVEWGICIGGGVIMIPLGKEASI